MMHIADQSVRELALDPTRSFIVEAPAGSGKTELLTRRYLRLLACVHAPEEVLAITFTRKAAAEMRNRVLKALALAAFDAPPSEDVRVIWSLARAVQAIDQQYGWELNSHASRLRIMTIDALNSSLAKQLPVLSGAGATLAIARDAEALYADVALRLIERLSGSSEIADAVARLLRHLDNQFSLFKGLLAKELARREYWLDLGLMRFDLPVLRESLERALNDAVTAELKVLQKSVPEDICGELVSLATHAGTTLRAAESDSAIALCHELSELPAATADALQHWHAISELLLTKEGEWRARIDKNTGFLPTHKEPKQRMQDLLTRLERESHFKDSLNRARELPFPRYTDAQWQILNDLLGVLKLAVAELELVMRERGETDYVANAIAARRALGSTHEPTDLALRLDYKLQHVLVDEFQDTSRGQVELLALLTAGWNDGDGRTLFCVGDPMQSIYRFRHADVGLFLNLKRSGLNQLTLTPLRLSVNFRSTQPVMRWINETFADVLPYRDDPERGAVSFTASQARPDASNAGHIEIHPIVYDADGDKEQARETEARAVANIILDVQAKRPESKIAVLVNNRLQLQWIIRELRDRTVAFQAVEIDPLLDRPVIQDLIALTRALIHLGDRTAWLAVLRAPWCGLSLSDLHTLANMQDSPIDTMWKRINDTHVLAQLSDDGAKCVDRAREQFRSAFLLRGRIALRECVERTWNALGGPATVTTESALQDAAAFFDRLALIERNGDLESIEHFEESLRDLYAASGSASNVELMTIHRSKGLEFDVVILPGLDSSARYDDPPLLRAQERPELGDRALLLAPIAARGEEHNAIYAWLGQMERERSAHEKARLLYVAATRAECELHLLGALEQGKMPRSETFLSLLWPRVKTHFENVAALKSESREAVEIIKSVQTRRIPVDWQTPGPSAVVNASTLRDIVSESLLHPEFEWVGETARHVGTLVHREIERIARDGFGRAALHELSTYEAALAELGVPTYLRATAAQRVLDSLKNLLGDERGRWLLQQAASEGAGHREAASEFELSGVVDGEIVNVVIDRTFVTNDGTRWIVDFKTSTHEGGGLEEFLSSEAIRYRPQLLRYAKLMRAFRPDEPIRAALYFPLLKAWREIQI